MLFSTEEAFVHSVDLREYQLFQLEILKEFVRICELHDLKYYLAYGTLLGAARHQGFIPWDDDIDVWMPARDYLAFRQACKDDLHPGFYFQSHGDNPCNTIMWQRIGVKSSTSMPVEYTHIHAEWGICIDIFPYVLAPEPGSYAYKKMCRREKFLYRLANKYEYALDVPNSSGLRKLYNLFWAKMPDSLNIKLFKHVENKILHIDADKGSDYYHTFELDTLLKKSWLASATELTFEDMQFKVPIGYKEILDSVYGDDWCELPPENERVWHSGGGGEGFIVSLSEPYEKFLL